MKKTFMIVLGGLLLLLPLASAQVVNPPDAVASIARTHVSIFYLLTALAFRLKN